MSATTVLTWEAREPSWQDAWRDLCSLWPTRRLSALGVLLALGLSAATGVWRLTAPRRYVAEAVLAVVAPFARQPDEPALPDTGALLGHLGRVVLSDSVVLAIAQRIGLGSVSTPAPELVVSRFRDQLELSISRPLDEDVPVGSAALRVRFSAPSPDQALAGVREVGAALSATDASRPSERARTTWRLASRAVEERLSDRARELAAAEWQLALLEPSEQAALRMRIEALRTEARQLSAQLSRLPGRLERQGVSVGGGRGSAGLELDLLEPGSLPPPRGLRSEQEAALAAVLALVVLLPVSLVFVGALSRRVGEARALRRLGLVHLGDVVWLDVDEGSSTCTRRVKA